MSQTDELEVNVRRVAAILGTFNSFRRNVHGRPGENGYVVEYRHDESVTLAAGFAIEGIRFAVKNETAQVAKRDALLSRSSGFIDITPPLILELPSRKACWTAHWPLTSPCPTPESQNYPWPRLPVDPPAPPFLFFFSFPTSPVAPWRPSPLANAPPTTMSRSPPLPIDHL